MLFLTDQMLILDAGVRPKHAIYGHLLDVRSGREVLLPIIHDACAVLGDNAAPGHGAGWNTHRNCEKQCIRYAMQPPMMQAPMHDPFSREGWHSI